MKRLSSITLAAAFFFFLTGKAGPEDGWYGGTASRFRLGLAGATRLGDYLKLQVGFGGLINMQKQGVLLGFSFAQFPFYLESKLAYCW